MKRTVARENIFSTRNTNFTVLCRHGSMFERGVKHQEGSSPADMKRTAPRQNIFSTRNTNIAVLCRHGSMFERGLKHQERSRSS